MTNNNSEKPIISSHNNAILKPLMCEFIRCGNLAAVNALFEIDRIVSEPKNNTEPLIVAATLGYTNIVSTLIQHGANVNFINSNHKSPLFCAIYFNNTKVAKLLIDAGADVNFVFEHDDMPSFSLLEYAISNKQETIAQYLIDSKHININYANEAGETALYTAARLGNLNIVKAIIEKFPSSADYCKYINDQLPITPAIQGAVESKNTEVFNYILAHTSDHVLESGFGANALHTAISSNQFFMTRQLYERMKQAPNESVAVIPEDPATVRKLFVEAVNAKCYGVAQLILDFMQKQCEK